MSCEISQLIIYKVTKRKRRKKKSKIPHLFSQSNLFKYETSHTERHNYRLLFHTNCAILPQIYLIWTIPALTSFWILLITMGFFVCSCAALGFSWKSTNTCIDSTHPTLISTSRSCFTTEISINIENKGSKPVS